MASPFPGIDPEELRRLMEQFQATPADKQQALGMGLLSGGLALAGARKGQEFNALAQAGLLGVGNYRGALQDAMQQRGQTLTQALAAMKLSKDAQFTDAGMRLINGGSGPALPQQPQYGMNDRGAGPMPDAQPAAAALPSASMPQAPNALTAGRPTWANPNAELGFALAGKKDVADVIHRNSTLTQGPSGTLMYNGSIVGQAMPNGLVIYRNGDPAQPQFFKNPDEAMAAVAQQAGMTAGAQKAAEFPYQIDTAVGPAGEQRRGYAANLYGQPPVPGAMPAASRTPTPAPNGRGGFNLNAQGMSADDLRAVAEDAARQQQAGGVVVGPNPLTQKKAEAAIGSQAAQDTEIAKGYAADYLEAVKGERTAPVTISKYERMKDYFSKVDTGKLAPTVMNLKAYASYIAPDLAKGWTADVPYAQAADALGKSMALELRNPTGGAGMPGALSDSDRKFLESMTSTLASDPRAIPMMIDAKIAVEKRAQDVGKLAREYKSTHKVIDEGFYQTLADYSNTHPLFQASAAPAAQTNNFSAQQIMDEMRRRGLAK